MAARKTVDASVTDLEANYAAYVQAATRAVIGDPIRAIARETDLDHNQTRRVDMICGHTVEEFREHVRRNKQLIIDLLDQRLPELVGQLKPMEAFVASGIMHDKYRDMTGGTVPSAVHITNIQVNGASRSEAMKALTGQRESFQQGTRPSENARAPIEAIEVQ